MTPVNLILYQFTFSQTSDGPVITGYEALHDASGSVLFNELPNFYCVIFVDAVDNKRTPLGGFLLKTNLNQEKDETFIKNIMETASSLDIASKFINETDTFVATNVHYRSQALPTRDVCELMVCDAFIFSANSGNS